MKIDIIKLEKERFAWSQQTFPEATPLGSLAKAFCIALTMFTAIILISVIFYSN